MTPSKAAYDGVRPGRPTPQESTANGASGREVVRRRRSTRLQTPKYLRQSYIARADACMLSLRFELESHQRQLPGQIGLLGARGTLFHRFAAQALQFLRDRNERSLPPDVAMELLTHVVSQVGVPDEDFVLLPMREMRWLRVLAMRWCYQHEFDVERIVAVEQRLWAPLEYEGADGQTETAVISGQPDVLLTGPAVDEATMIDWKTGWAPPARRVTRNGQTSEDRLSDMGYVQQLVYGWLVMTRYPAVQRVTEREWYVMANDDPVREATIERWELERIQDVLAARVAGIYAALRAGKRSKRWVPVAGAHCGTCPRPRDCLIRDEVGIPATLEEAQELAREWIVGGAIRKEREPLIKGWIDAHGPVEIAHSKGRREVGWVPNKTGHGRTFRLYEPQDADESPFDQDLERALEQSLRERGLEPDA